MKVLMIEWQSEYPFTHEHKETINKVIEWVKNLIKGLESNCKECGGHFLGGYLLHTGECPHLYDKQETIEGEE